MKRFKKVIVLFIFAFTLGLSISPDSLYAQSLDGKAWRMQYKNDNLKHICFMFVFGKVDVTCYQVDMKTGGVSEMEGTYDVRSDSLFLVFPNNYDAFSLKWICGTTVVISKSSKEWWCLAVLKSRDDTYLDDYAKATSKDE